jgi:hypothetical protein
MYRLPPGQRRSQAARCARYVTVGTFRHRDQGGRNGLRFPQPGWLQVTPGSYLLETTPSANGTIGRTVKAAFNVVQ